ncbi:P protein [Drosophila guanche]|uniref:Blast:P protein n=1 Tax=Drosophila guanche TaxID=7266 RepID=A0A3B0JER7_DROGU|nr:P protein [Drosophila guanche]XP_034126362.1 P protein [Drosophila guanche]SPP79153.1 blast:P protein [Drosophila guanche]
MGLRDTFRQLRPDSPSRVGSSSIELQNRADRARSSCHQNQVGAVQVTEQSLQVWRALPAEIRHDPSMASFQMENERVHGSSAGASDDYDDEDDDGYDVDEANNVGRLQDEPGSSFAGSDFLEIKSKPVQEENPTDDEATTTHSDHDPANGPGNAKSLARRIHHKSTRSKEQRQWDKLWKRLGLLLFWLLAAVVLISVGEKHLLDKTLDVPQGEQGKFFTLVQKPAGDFRLKIQGAFEAVSPADHDENETISYSYLFVQPQVSAYIGENRTKVFQNTLHAWQLPLLPDAQLERAPAVSRNRTYQMSSELSDLLAQPGSQMRLHIYSDAATDLAVVLSYNPLIVNARLGSILAGLILLIFYALLVWELFERPFIAMICSILSVTALACFNDRPNMDEIIQWMDMELLTLLFCMMLLILILTETGVFDYLAVFCFEISGGKIWPMIYSLCLVTCLVSSVLDNMTTVLLLTPVAIRLCEVMQLDPLPVVMGIIVHANIGGALTPIGDPISIIVSTNHNIVENDVTFLTFVAHTFPGVLLAVIQSCLYLRLFYHNIDALRLNEPKEMRELRREIKVWQRALNAVGSCSKDAQLVRGTLQGKVKQLKRTLRRLQRGVGSTEVYANTLDELKQKYPIKNQTLLLQSAGALIFVIVCFFIQSVPHWRTLPLGWVALLGVILLLIILNRDDMEHLMHRIEWTTLLFFAAMFVMMECVERLGLFSCIGEFTEHVILSVDKRHRLAMAIFIILWASALASAILDSIPVTALMVKLVTSLVAKPSMGLPLQPLVWALTLGASLGGNGTLYGASANVIAAGIAEQHGYKLSFTRYLKTVFPMMIGQITLMTVYLLVAHIVFGWH